MGDRVDVVVVGAGIAGLSAAWAIADQASVVVLEQEDQPATQATGRSAALITETYGPAAVCALAGASRSFLADPPDGFCDGPLLSPRGMLWVGAEAGVLDDVAAQAAALGAAHTRLSATEAASLVPVLRAERVGDALLEPEVMAIDVGRLVGGYRSGLLARGGTILTRHRADAITPRAGGWVVEHRGGTVEGRIVVDAAGAWADEVAAAAGLAPLGLRPRRRTAFLFPVGGHDVAGWPLVMDAGGRFYFGPEGELLLASPADETEVEPHDARADEMAMARAVDALAEATTLTVGGVRQRWAGLRTFAPDRLPVVGFDPRAPGFFWLAGQGGAGIKTAPALAELARALLLDDRPCHDRPLDLDALLPHRLL